MIRRTVLKKFSDREKIAFPLLSDPESKTIEAYHIRNEAAKGRAEGVPNPGTFIVDQRGSDPREALPRRVSRPPHDGSTDRGGEDRQVIPWTPE